MGKRAKRHAADAIIEVVATAGETEALELAAVGGDPGEAVGATAASDPVPATVARLIQEVAGSVVPAARAAGAGKFGAEFGVRIRKDGSATLAELADGAAFRVFLEWTDR